MDHLKSLLSKIETETGVKPEVTTLEASFPPDTQFETMTLRLPKTLIDFAAAVAHKANTTLETEIAVLFGLGCPAVIKLALPGMPEALYAALCDTFAQEGARIRAGEKP